MSDKISPVAVVKEAVALSWRRKWTFLGLMLVGIVPVALAMGLIAAAWSQSGSIFFLTSCVHILGMLFLATTSNHLAVTMQRGTGTVFPQPFWSAMGRVFVRGLIVVALVFAVMILFLLPTWALTYLYLPQDGGAPGSPMLFPLIIFVGVASYAFVVAIMLRLGIMIPAASVGVVVSVRQALAMSSGHAWRMLLSMLLVILPVFLLSVILQLFIASAVTTPSAAVLVLPVFLLLLINLLSCIVMIVLNAVWYEKLRLLADGPESGFDPAFKFAPGAAPRAASAPRAGSGVGPYADLPGE